MSDAPDVGAGVGRADADIPPVMVGLSSDRVAEAVGALAETCTDPHQRTQLHALRGVVQNLGVTAAPDDPADVERVVAAMEGDDVQGVVRVARSLARDRRRRIAIADWSRASA